MYHTLNYQDIVTLTPAYCFSNMFLDEHTSEPLTNSKSSQHYHGRRKGGKSRLSPLLKDEKKSPYVEPFFLSRGSFFDVEAFF